jgi:hypothetical protein
VRQALACVEGARFKMTSEHDPVRWTIDYQIDSQNDGWIAVVADSGMCCRATTENFWLALGAAQRAKGIKLTDWKLALEILKDQIERSKNRKRAEERSLRSRMIEDLATKLGPDA